MPERVICMAILSGGIGSGKSTIGRMLAAAGAFVIDADVVGHDVLKPDGEAYEAVAARWPEAVVDGRIDRGALARVVFAEADRLRELEAITHPAIRSRIQAAAEASSASVIVVELPLATDLLGPGWPRAVVMAPAATRLARLQARGMDRADATRRMAAQPSDEAWRRDADFVVDNTGDLAQMGAEVDRLWEWLTTCGDERS